MATRNLDFKLHPDLLSRQLGADLYTAPEALKQLVANGLDADCSRVDIRIAMNKMETPERVILRDDGRGIPPDEMVAAFQEIGSHLTRSNPKRPTIGSRGIGRFAVFALAAESYWETISQTADGLVRQRWTMVPGRVGIEVESTPIREGQTGTTVEMVLHQRSEVSRLFASDRWVKRVLFNSFVGYLAQFGDEVGLWVNDEEVKLDDFIDDSELEEIKAHGDIPDASMRHLVLSHHVDQAEPSMLVFAAHGTTISQAVLGDEGIPNRKYLGVVDSPFLADLTNTGKSLLAEFDPGFIALRDEASSRSRKFIESRQAGRAQEFLQKARAHPSYPYRNPPQTPVDRYRRQLYDGILLSLEETYRISSSSPHQFQLILGLSRQLLQSEDLASVLTSVLDLKGEEVVRFASLLKRTSLSSVIAVADLLVDRRRFLDELNVLVYGHPAPRVLERRHLHKILERHTWLFGEEFHLMGSDRRLDGLLKEIRAKYSGDEEEDELLSVPEPLLDIPDLYLTSDKWNEGAKYTQHLVVELKRPSLRLQPRHFDQVRRYATEIVNHPSWPQNSDSHRFTFVLVSSDVRDDVLAMYLKGEKPGLISRPSLKHPTELWALKWSDYIDQRLQELRFLESELNVTADPELLEYLQSRVGEFLPSEAMESSTEEGVG